MKRGIIIGLLLGGLFTASVSAQKEKKIEGTYTYVYTSAISLKQAQNEAEEKAKEEAIKNAFPGTIMAQTNTIIESKATNSRRTKEYSKFYSTGVSEYKGEWISDLQAPTFTEPQQDGIGNWFITCNVKGLAREVTWNRPEFQWQLMRNHVEERSAACEFKNGDELFMTFKAPSDGYLVVFLTDELGMAYSLVPNAGDPKGSYPVRGGQRYVFFSDKHNNQDGAMPTDPLLTMALDETDYNQVYVFFSPNPITRPVLTKGGNVWVHGESVEVPDYLEYAQFQKWQQRLLSRDKSLQREKRMISISRK
ncbi:MAG: hypothetical protein IJQ44_04075 [Bacteroidaceae bacterium]|nr:hypothetical protein [Bacteroidaceae bacterium]